MAVETIYLNKKNEAILEDVPGENNSQKIGFLIEKYVSDLE